MYIRVIAKSSIMEKDTITLRKKDYILGMKYLFQILEEKKSVSKRDLKDIAIYLQNAKTPDGNWFFEHYE